MPPVFTPWLRVSEDFWDALVYAMRKKEDPSPKLVQLNSLFDVYKKRLRAPQGSVITAFCEVVEDVLGVPLDASQCSYTPHTRTLTIQARGPFKSEIMLHKKELMTHLKARLGEQSAPKALI